MPTSSRFFVKDNDTPDEIDAHQELLASLQRINTLNPPVQTCSTGWTFYGLYLGPTSIAYLFYRLSSVYPDMEFKGQSLRDWSEAYLDLSSHIPKADPDPDHCGITTETIAYYTLKAIMLSDTSLVDKLCSYQNIINTKSRSGSNEWVYGRAGYLYFLRLAQMHFDADKHSNTHKLLTQTIGKTVERTLEEPQPWTWHGSQYIGAAHGVVGIICQVILSDPSTAPRLQDLLAYMLGQQDESGNFPSALPARADDLVQFCHGSPGFILSLESIRPHFPVLRDEIDKVIARARQDVQARGLLTKEPSLCHGIAGNALALESHEQMATFLAYMTTDAMERRGWTKDAGKTDEFASLYTGEAGRAWAWAVLDRNLPRTCIGYNDL